MNHDFFLKFLVAIKAGRRYLLCGLLLTACSSSYGVLDLNDALDLALSDDPGVDEILQDAEGLRSDAVAQSQLSDPVFLLGALNFPVDTFDFDQEPMTQLLVGAKQMFPQGSTLSLTEEKLLKKADSIHARAQARYLRVTREVRRIWLEILYWIRARDILNQDIQLFDQLLDVTQSMYSVGKVQQKDVLRAELELSRLQEKLIRANRTEQKNRATLARWIGVEARQAEWPLDIPDLRLGVLAQTVYSNGTMPPEFGNVASALRNHPVLTSVRKQVDAADLDLQLSKEKYKPAWGVEVGYGFRDGQNPNGSNRSDFFSAKVTVSMPFFTRHRQDKSVESSIYRKQARIYAVDEQVLEMTGMVEQLLERLLQTDEQLALFDDELLSRSKLQVEAARNAYQSDAAGFDEVMRAYLREQKDRLDYQRLLIERQQLISDLQFYFPEAVPDLTERTGDRSQ